MVPVRKRHVQQELPKLDKNGQRRGGTRRGSGRPKKRRRSSERHEARSLLTGREPILVTVRTSPEVGNVRTRNMYRAIRFALYATALRDDFRIIHFSIQR